MPPAAAKLALAPARPREAEAWSPLDFERETLRPGGGGSDDEAAHRRFAREGVRTLFAPLGGSGVADLVRLPGGAIVNVVNCVLPTLARWAYRSDEPLIMLRASLSCDVTFRFDGLAPMVFNRPEVTLACVPKGRLQAVDIAGGVRQQGIVAVIRAATFAQQFGLQVDDVPPAVREALHGEGSPGRIASFPLDHRIAALVADTVETRLDGEMRVLQYAGRLAELVAFTLDAMQHTPSLRGPALQRRRDVELAHDALKRLERDYRKPPRFAELAREIGTNQNKLKAVFKEAFGVTMAEYCLERRMREAQQLLLEAALTIAQVAERVGYEHQSSFAAAFHAQVGMSPREYRQHRAAFSVPLAHGRGA